MPESDRAELPADVSEPESPPKEHAFWTELIEVVEVIVLALVAIATAWSGYQAAKWDGRQSLLYGTASTDRFKADAASTAGGQELVADASLFTAWLQATAAHDSTLAALYVRRFTPHYRAAFQAWLKTDPLTNSAAPAGPAYMPQYRNPDHRPAVQDTQHPRRHDFGRLCAARLHRALCGPAAPDVTPGAGQVRQRWQRGQADREMLLAGIEGVAGRHVSAHAADCQLR